MIPVILLGATDNEFTVTVTEAHVVVLQVPSARTKYVVLDEGLTGIEEPIPIGVPPHEEVYQ